MSVLGAVLGAKLAYIIEHGKDPSCVLLHPLTIGRASVEMWELHEEVGRYGFPKSLNAIHGMKPIADNWQDEGAVWVGTERDYEALCSGRLEAWRLAHGLSD